MSEKDELKIDVKSLTEAHDSLEKALDELRDVDIFSIEDYEKLCDIAEIVNDLRIRKESELEGLCDA